MSAHLREILSAPRDRQRVRVGGVVGDQAGRWPWNGHGPWGQYAEVYAGSGCVWCRWAPRSTPPFEHTVCVVDMGDASAPRVVIDARARVWVSLVAGGNVYVVYSEDDGLTWSEEEEMFASGTWPTIAVGADGALLIGARVAGVLKVRRRAPGDTAWQTAFTAQDDAAADLALADDSFHLAAAPEGPGRWVLHARLDGETDTVTLASADDGETWGEF